VAAADLGYVGQNDISEDFFRVAQITPVNAVSHPVKSDWGYHIIKVLDKKYSRSLDQVRHEIIMVLRRQYEQDYIKSWEQEKIAAHDVVYNLEPIKRITLDPKNRR
jgi:parvulin-like peptidyl-prolyl isomerase